MPTGIRLSSEIKNQVVNYYLSSPMSISECAKTNGLSSPTVIKILDEYNIERYKKARIFNPELDEHFFEVIDTEAKAYYLGLLITDGNVFVSNDRSNRQASISLTQSEADSYILYRFLKEVKSNCSIGHDGRGVCQAAIRSDVMAQDLSRYGVAPRKTYFAYLPIVESNYMRHLIRGILDGDGCIISSMQYNRKHKHCISFCGTHILMDDLATYLSLNLNVQTPKVYDYTDRMLSEIKWQNINDILTIGNYLYNDAEIFLERKYNAFLDFKNHYCL